MLSLLRAQLFKPPRTVTAHESVLKRNEDVTLTFGQPRPANLSKDGSTQPANCVKFTFAPIREGVEGYNTGLHFHVDKTEYLRVERGRIGVQLGTEKLVITPESGEITIPRWTPHAWYLLPSPTPNAEAEEDETTIIWERTDPPTREKEVFFRNLLCVLADTGSARPGSPPSFLQLFTIFAEMDNYVVLGSWTGFWGRRVAVWVTRLVGGLGRLVGYEAMYEEYTPAELFHAQSTGQR